MGGGPLTSLICAGVSGVDSGMAGAREGDLCVWEELGIGSNKRDHAILLRCMVEGTSWKFVYTGAFIRLQFLLYWHRGQQGHTCVCVCV